MKINKTPRFFLQRVQEIKNPDFLGTNYPNIFPLTRVGQIKWWPDEEHKKLENALLAKQTVIIS